MKLTFTLLLLAGVLSANQGAWAQTTGTKLLLQKGKTKTAPNQRLLNLVSLPGTSENYANDMAGGWTHYSNSTYTYDAQGRLTQRIDAVPVTNQNIYKNTYVYDAQGNETEVSNYNWDNNQWVKTSNSYRQLYTYNASNKPTEFIYQLYIDVTQTYQNDWRTVTTYNAAGYIASETFFDYNNNAWEPVGRNTYTFTSPTAPPTGLLVEEYVSGLFVNSDRYTNITWHNYDEFKILGFTAETWNGAGWDLSERVNVSHDQFGGSIETTENYVGGNWELSNRYTETYDSHFNYTGSKSETWIGSAWMTDSEDQEVLTYNANNDITQRVFRNMFNINGTLEDDRKEVYANFVYITATPANEAELPVSVFPNPALDKVNITSQLTGTLTLSLTDLAGRTVHTQVIDAANAQISLGQITSGTYLLHLHNQTGSLTTKIVKL